MGKFQVGDKVRLKPIVDGSEYWKTPYINKVYKVIRVTNLLGKETVACGSYVFYAHDLMLCSTMPSNYTGRIFYGN